MSFFIRKIESQKWLQNDILNGEAVSADAITGSLRTSGNTLSIWEIKSDAEINDAIIAIVSLFEKADSIDIIKIDPNDLDKKFLSYNKSEGRTAHHDFIDRHFDISELTYRKLGDVAAIVVDLLKKNPDVRIRRKQIKSLLIESISNGKLKKADLHPKLLEDLGVTA